VIKIGEQNKSDKNCEIKKQKTLPIPSTSSINRLRSCVANASIIEIKNKKLKIKKECL
jgi:hypothetical protein